MIVRIYSLIKKKGIGILNYFGVNVVRHNVYTSEDIQINTILNHFGITTILDVGANAGQYALLRIMNGFKGKVLSFEPINSVYKDLFKIAEEFPQWNCYNVGLGSKEEKLSMNISENVTSSSIFKVAQASLKAEPATRIIRNEVINIITLDSFLNSNLMVTRPLFLKIDVQGYEMEVLRGAKETLSSVKLIQLELSIAPVYDMAPLYREIIEFLEANNFEMYSIFPGFMDSKTGQLLQFDGLFVNRKL